jgi:hypothetical protein
MQLLRRLWRSREERFAWAVLRAVRATGRVAHARYDPHAFAIRFHRDADDAGGWIYLHSSFRECAGMGRADRALRINALVAAVTSSSTGRLGWAEVAPRLRPVLRGAGFGQSSHAETGPLLSRPALPYLVELVVVDEPTSMAYVLASQVQEWGVDPAEVFATARTNLRALADGVLDGPAAGGNVVLRLVDTGDAYFTSMVLLDGFLESLADLVGGRPVAFIHDRDNLTVIADDPAGVATMLELVERHYNDAARSLSPVAYTCDDRGAVVPYVAAEPGPLADRVHRAQVVLAAAEYQSQKEALDAQYEREGRDVFVGSLIVAERPDGTLFSVAVWTDYCVTLLPQADLVCFQSAGAAVMVPWPTVARTAGLRPEPDLVPDRYLVRSWPDKATLDHLRAEAVSL